MALSELAMKLAETIAREYSYLRALDNESASTKPENGGWSPKEELGHLIDSATNNHVRFIRASFEPRFEGPYYAQDDWVRLHQYQEMPWRAIVEFWFAYNTFLADVIARISPGSLDTECRVGNDAPVTLAFLIDDYVLHMQHHIDHLLHRENITKYPRVA
jgi:hypothetical protein